MRRFTSLVVLVCFLTTLMAPALEAAALIPVKVPGRQVLFDVNTATAQELASIPGIGPKTAAEIVRYRTQFGPFKTIQDVGNVSGVGKARLSRLVSGATQAARPDLLLKQSPVKPAPAPAPAPVAKPVVATPEPPAVWVTGNNGSRVNVNVSNTKSLVTQLVKAGFPNEQVNILANTRLVGNGSSLKFQPFKNLADLQTRLISVGGKGIVDVSGAQIVQKTVSAPAAPSEPVVQTKPVPGVDGQALVYNAGERLMFRFDAGGKAVTVNLNQQSASGLYKQLRAAGVPTSTAKAVAEARIKGTFKNFADLTSRVPQMDSVSRPAAARSAVTEPAAPAKQTAAAAPAAAPSQAAEAQLAKLSKQYEAIVKRTPTSDTGYSRTLKSLQDTYDGMFKSLAEKAAAEGKVANADALAKDARLQRIARDIDAFSRNQKNLAKAQSVNKATAALDVELSKYSKQADAIIQRTPTSLEGYNRTLDSLQNAYKDLYSRLEMKARLSGGSLSAEALVKDPRMQKIAQAIDNVRTQKAQFQSTKAANVEQARANEAKAAARKAAAQPAEAPAAPVEEPAAPRSTPSEQAAALKSRVEYTNRISEMSAQAKQLFSEIKAESGGRFTSNRDVWEAAKNYEGKGKLADLRKLGSNIQQMRQARNAAFPAEPPAKEAKTPAPAKAKPAAEQPAPAKQAKATAPSETPAAPATEQASAKPMTELQKLSQQAKALNAKLLEGGQFKSAQEVYKASEAPGAKGELAQLKQVNEQIRSMRAATKPASQVAETPAGPAKASVIGDASAPAESAAPKAKWTDGFLKAVKGGQFKSTDGGWADSYMKMLKGDGVVETARTATGPKASEIAAPAVEKAPASGGWADTYVKMLKGELVADTAASTAAPKQSWWSKLFGRRAASVPTAEAPAGRTVETPAAEPTSRIAELPTDLPKASELGSSPSNPANVKASITELQGQAKALNLKLKSTGQFSNSAEIFKASEAPGASGDLAALKGINDQIRALRASRTGATVAPTETPVTEPTAKPVETAPTEAAAPKTNKLMDWLTGKNAPGRKLLGGKTATPAAETPVAEPTAKPVETAPTEAAAPKTNKFMDWLTGKNTPGGKLLGGKGAAPAVETAVTEPTAKPVESPSASGKTVSPSAESPASLGRSSSIAELPVEAPVSKPATVAKIEAIDTQISNLRTQAHDAASSLVKSGQFNNVAEVVKAAEAPGVTGKVAEVGQLNQNIKALTVEKVAVANAAPAASEGLSGSPVVAKGLAEVTGAAGSSTDFAVKFGSKVHDLGRMTAGQIEAETGGLIKADAAKKIADAAAANGGKLSVSDLSKLGLTDDVVATLKRGNTDAVKTQLQDARAKAVEKFGADSEVVKKIDSNLEQLKGQGPSEPKASVTGGNADVLAARTTQLETVNAKIAQLEGKTGLLAKFTKGKQLKTLYEQKSALEKEIQSYKDDPSKLDTANKAYQQKNQKVFAEQARQVGVLEAELAKVDPNSRYGRALTERIDQIKASAPESFGKQATNMFLIAAGTNILLTLARQMKNGEKLDLGAAVKSIANPQFLLGTAGAAVGAYAGTKFAFSKLGLILTTKLGSFLPPVGRVFLQMLPAMAGGALGSTLLSGGFAEADWVEIGATTIGSTLGTAIAASFFPGMGLFGQIGAGMMGAEVAKFILKMVRGDPESETAAQDGASGGANDPNAADANAKASELASNFTEKDVADAFNAMSIYYQRYVQFEKDGNYGDAAQAYEKYAALKARLDQMRSASFQARAK